MNKIGQEPIVKVWSREIFEKRDISEQFQYAVSIQEYNESPNIVRPDYKGKRLNLYFNDANREEDWVLAEHETKGEFVFGKWVPDKVMREQKLPGCPTREDIDKLMEFSEKWVKVAKEDVFSARLVVHCFAGVSRSAACAMLPLYLYYGDYQEASDYLYGYHPWVMPNTLILRHIKEILNLNPRSM